MNKSTQQINRQRRIRQKIRGTSDMPRLSVFRSNAAVSAQIIDDVKRVTLLGLSQKHLGKVKGTKTEIAKQLGQALAKEAVAKKIKRVVFDKGAYAYHGRVKAIADGAREGGLVF